MARLFFYKLTVDDGGAPCVQDGVLSLAICKPMIRRVAEEGDIVIGFAANSLYPDNRLIYVARVTAKLPNGDYFRSAKYADRGDCIYEWRDGRFVVRPDALYHGSLGDLVHDLGQHPGYPKADTLLSRQFCYFGASGSDAYKTSFPLVAAAVEALGRGHRTHHDPALAAELHRMAKWSHALDGARIQGEPKDTPRCRVSHRGRGCGVAVDK